MKKMLAYLQSLRTERGFTMIELLVVIAIIGILAVAVVASLNPIEQINKSTDTTMRTDAAQLNAAALRYYATFQEFPWNTEYATTPETEYEFVGGTDDELWLTQLLDRSELKDTFVTKVENEDFLTVVKATGSNESIYVCFKPTSDTFQETAAADCASGATPTSVTTNVTLCATTDGTVDPDNHICVQ